MSTQQLETLLDEAAKVAAQTRDPALLEESGKLIRTAQIYQAANYVKDDPLESLRKAWNAYARELRQSLRVLGDVFDETIADIRKVRAAIIDLLRELNAAESARLEATTDFGTSAASSTGDAIGDMKRQTRQITGELQKVVQIAQVVPLLDRVVRLDRAVEAFAMQFGNPRRRLLVALFAIRGIRTLNLALRGVLSAAIYVGVFSLSYFFDDSTKEFVAGLLAGQASNIFILFCAMLLIEFAKGKIVETLVEKPLRRLEAHTTGKEMESLSGLGVKIHILIAKMRADLEGRIV